jgi:hypothetical protein
MMKDKAFMLIKIQENTTKFLDRMLSLSLIISEKIKRFGAIQVLPFKI